MKHPGNWFKSLGYAVNGLWLVSEERNVKFHLAGATAVCILAYILELSLKEWAFTGSAIAGVLITEIFNTIVEQLCDLIQPTYSTAIKKIKDMAASAVLVAAIYALLIAVCILIPKLISYS